MFSGVLCGRRLFLKLLYGDFYFVVVQNYTRAHVDQNSCAVLLSGRGRLSPAAGRRRNTAVHKLLSDLSFLHFNFTFTLTQCKVLPHT